MKLGIIGAGNMAMAIVNGLLKKGVFTPEEILVSRRDKNALEKWQEELKVNITTDNRKVAEEAEILLLAVKPQRMAGVIEEIKDRVRQEQLLITIAAGKTISWYEETFGKEIHLVRAMPNTPAMVKEGCTGYCINNKVSEEEKEKVEKILESYGKCYFLPESLMDTYGALAGSGPAFVFLFLEALADGAVLNGMPRQMAYEMAAQTLLGSSKLWQETKKHPGELKDMVCSPGGTTICGIQSLEEGSMRAAVMAAISSCVEKSRKL